LEYLGESAIGIWPARSGSLVRVRVGRLVEVRLGRLACVADVESLNAAVVGAMRSAGAFGSGVVVCADHRSASPVPSDLADPWSRGMRGVNRSISRSAILLNPANVTFNLQIQRVVQCAGSAERRVFTDRQEVQEWLDGRLSEAERAALRVFLDGPA
jgi:hypothetical protein